MIIRPKSPRPSPEWKEGGPSFRAGDAALLAYQLLYPVIALAVLLKLLLAGRGKALREGLPDIRQRCGLLPAAALSSDEERTIWVHAASVGEVLAAAPLIRELAKADSPSRVLLTTSTVAGRERGARLRGVSSAFLAPMDFYPAVRAFLRRVRPASLILIETELWPMTLREAARSGVALGLANGRITARAFRRYLWIRGLMRTVLESFDRAAVQSEEDAERFESLGMPAEAVTCAGNMKYDLPSPPESDLEAARERFRKLGWTGCRTWTAGSTRRGEEALVLDAQRAAREKLPGLRLVLAPRHPERTEEVAGILRDRGVRFSLWSDPPPSKPPECLLVDTMGVLPPLYAAADAAFVGGTLVPVGGHNILEPAILERPVLFGPHTSSLSSVAEALKDAGGGRVATDGPSLARELLAFLSDDEDLRGAGRAARAASKRFTGATRRTLEHLGPLL